MKLIERPCIFHNIVLQTPFVFDEHISYVNLIFTRYCAMYNRVFIFALTLDEHTHNPSLVCIDKEYGKRGPIIAFKDGTSSIAVRVYENLNDFATYYRSKQHLYRFQLEIENSAEKISERIIFIKRFTKLLGLHHEVQVISDVNPEHLLEILD